MYADTHKHAKEDLDKLWENNPAAAAEIQVLIEELQRDPDAIDKLTTRGDNNVGGATINVKDWKSMRLKGNVWRFRAIDTPATGYRVIYIYHWESRHLCFLAIADKDNFDYDNHSSELNKRIIADVQAF